MSDRDLGSESNPWSLTAEVADWMDPSLLQATLRTLSVDKIVSRIAAITPERWLTTAIMVGVAQEQATRGDHLLESLASALGQSRTTVVRLGQAYREIIRPLLDPGAETRAEGVVKYASRRSCELAIRQARLTGRPPVTIFVEMAVRRDREAAYPAPRHEHANPANPPGEIRRRSSRKSPRRLEDVPLGKVGSLPSRDLLAMARDLPPARTRSILSRALKRLSDTLCQLSTAS